MSDRFVLGVDGGNTKTIALVGRCDGAILGVGRGGCGDIYGASSPEAAVREVVAAVETALATAGITRGDLAVGFFSMAGADWPEDFSFLEAALRAHGLGREIVVVNDALGALRAGSPDGTGVVVTLGTGIAVGARAPDGRAWHSSFWAEPHGAHGLGQRAFRAVLRAELGIDPPTILTARVVEHLGCVSVEEALHRVTARAAVAPPPDLAGLARILLDEASRGDEVAAGIVAAAGELAGDYAVAAARRVGLLATPFWLALAGGVFRHPGGQIERALVARVQREAPAARPLRGRFEPAVGALLLALERAGVVVETSVLSRVEATIPTAALFAT